MVSIKISNQGVPPILAAAIRSVFASFFLLVYLRIQCQKAFFPREYLVHGIAIGGLFGVEFLLLYLGNRLHGRIQGGDIFVHPPVFRSRRCSFFAGRRSSHRIQDRGTASRVRRTCGSLRRKTVHTKTALLGGGSNGSGSRLFVGGDHGLYQEVRLGQGCRSLSDAVRSTFLFNSNLDCRLADIRVGATVGVHSIGGDSSVLSDCDRCDHKLRPMVLDDSSLSG